MSVSVVDNPIDVPNRRSFATLDEAYVWANGIVNAGIGVQASRIYADRINPPRSRLIKILGVEKKAEKFCRKMEPNGEWRVEIETPGTEYTAAGILSPVTKTTKLYRFMAWYSRFLPYAYAMMKAEWDHRCMGVDYDTINSYYGTCKGFIDIGTGDGNVEGYNRIEQADVDLFQEIYSVSSDLWSPGLPFEEAYRPCAVYVALFKPREIVKHYDRDSKMVGHIYDVCDKIGRPRPLLRWK